MGRKWRATAVGGGLALGLVGLGFVEWIGADRPENVLNLHADAVQKWDPLRTGTELRVPVRHHESDPLLTRNLQRVAEALAQKNVSAAVRAWHEAYALALGSRRWEGMLAVGDAWLRVGEVSGSRKASEAKVRELYLAAFFRARDQRSLDGVLRAAEAFAALGDQQVAEQAIHVAQRLAAQAQDAQVRERVRAAAERLADRSFGMATLEF